MAVDIAPSVIAADFTNLEKILAQIKPKDAPCLHLDLMDGCFVPNIALGFCAIKAIAKASLVPLDYHLML